MRHRRKIDLKIDKDLFFVISSLLSLAVLFIVLVTVSLLTPKLKLDREFIKLNVFDDYIPVGYKATKLNKDISDKVFIDGEVDTSHVGQYKILYELKEGSFDIKRYLNVSVVDEEKPGIIFSNDADEFNVCSLENLNIKYSALDNYDGDITDNVKIEQGKDGNVKFSVMDSSGNLYEVIKKVNIEDKEGPVITLDGKKDITLYVGANYKEASAKASDNCDGDISSKIKVSGSVDTSKAGTYNVDYIVEDSAGNKTTLTRKVKVIEKQSEEVVVEDNNNTSGVIYLTFDDGPGGYTNKILDILAKYNIKATFFVTMAGSNDVIKREYDEGHTVALHTATHNYKQMYASVDAYFEDLNKVSNRVKDITGQETKIIRFPGGTSNHVCAVGMSNIVNAVKEKGYIYFDWNVSVEDAGGCVKASDKQACVLKNFKTYTKANRENIVLMHDIKGYTANALEDMIKYGISRGFTFKKIDENTTPVQFKPYR